MSAWVQYPQVLVWHVIKWIISETIRLFLLFGHAELQDDVEIDVPLTNTPQNKMFERFPANASEYGTTAKIPCGFWRVNAGRL